MRARPPKRQEQKSEFSEEDGELDNMEEYVEEDNKTPSIIDQETQLEP